MNELGFTRPFDLLIGSLLLGGDAEEQEVERQEHYALSSEEPEIGEG
jgi:hypothetical protein